MEISLEIPQRTENRTTIWSSNSTAGYMSEENENTILKRCMHPNVYSRIIYNSQDMRATLVSINRWTDKKDVVYIYNGMLCTNKKEWNFAIGNNMNGPRGYYAKWNKSDRERQILYVTIICGI